MTGIMTRQPLQRQHLFQDRVTMVTRLALLVGMTSVASAEGWPKPRHTDVAQTARWLMHESTWGVLSTISTEGDIAGFAFGNPQSVVDGPYSLLPNERANNASGVPYFYVSEMDVSQIHIAENANVSFTMSEAALPGSCQSTDPEDPTCVRLTLSGQMVDVAEDGAEHDFALAALFDRHPAMKRWPTDHGWKVTKLDVRHVFIIDFYGGAKPLSVADYFAAKM